MTRQPVRIETPGDRFRFFVLTSGGLGLAPVASGTFGTFGGIAIAVLLQLLFAGSGLTVALFVAGLLLLLYGCSLTDFTERTFPRKDPGAFVLDEVVGYLFAIAIHAGVWGEPSVAAHALCFFSFRAFDVLKLYPANRLEYIPGAPGIMLDDVMAGIYAGLSLLLIRPFVSF